MAEPQTVQQMMAIQRNNEAVSLIERGEYEQATRQLVDAIHDFRSKMAQYVSQLSSDGSNDNHVHESLSLDQWMLPSTEASHTSLSGSGTSSFFIYTKGILIPTNFLEENLDRYCQVDISTALASVIFFNQGLASHLASVQASSRDNQLLQKAVELYTFSIQCTRHMQSSEANAKFLMAAMNNLAVSERTYSVSSSTKDYASHYFETLRRFLVNWRPTTTMSPEEVLWNCYVDNVLLGLNFQYSTNCALS